MPFATRIPGYRPSAAHSSVNPNTPSLDLPCTYIRNPRTELTSIVGTASNFLWVAGDGNTPTIGPALTATGSPGSVESPYQLEDGTALNWETYTGAEYRRKADDATLTPADNEDFVIAALVNLPRDTTTYYEILGSWGNSSKGWFLGAYTGTGDIALSIYANSMSMPYVSAALGRVAMLVFVVNRDGNATGYLNGVAGTPAATPAGSIPTGHVSLGTRGDTSWTYKGGILFTAFWKGSGLNEIWTANSNELIKKVTAAFTGTLPRAGGLPTFARNSAASWKDRNGRYWLASPGLPRAGDKQTNSESGIRLAAARTNYAYRNVNPADGSTWLLDSAGCAYGATVITDGDMEAADTSAYGAANNAILSKETTTPHGGSKCLRVTYNGTNYPHATQTCLTVGKRYRITGWARGDGTHAAPWVDCGGVTGLFTTGTNSNTWQYFDASFTALAAYLRFIHYGAGTGYAEFDDIVVTPSMNLAVDGDFENSSATTWTAIGNATLSKETTTPHGGTYCLRVTTSGTGVSLARQNITTIGKTYRVTGWARGDGGTHRPAFYDYDQVALWTGTTANTWQYFDVTYKAATAYPGLWDSNAVGAGYVEFDDLWIEEAVQVTDDSTNLTTAKVECFGPNVFEFDNTAGTASRYMRQGSNAGTTNKYSYSVIGDLVTGSGAQLGYWNTADSTFTSLATISDSYVRTIYDNSTGAATYYLCIHIPAGCKARWIGQQLETNSFTSACVATSIIPNWATAATAARSQETLSMVETPSNTQGRFTLGFTPVGWTDSSGTSDSISDTAFVTQASTASLLLYNSANNVLYCNDGTSSVGALSSLTNNVRSTYSVKWRAEGRTMIKDGTTVGTGAYDGALSGTGTYRLNGGAAECAIDTFKTYASGK